MPDNVKIPSNVSEDARSNVSEREVDAEDARVELIVSKLSHRILEGVQSRLPPILDEQSLARQLVAEGFDVTKFIRALETEVASAKLPSPVASELDTPLLTRSNVAVAQRPSRESDTGSIEIQTRNLAKNSQVESKSPFGGVLKTPINRPTHRDEIMGTIARERSEKEKRERVAAETARLRKDQLKSKGSSLKASLNETTGTVQEHIVTEIDDGGDDSDPSSESSNEVSSDDEFRFRDEGKTRYPKPGSLLTGVQLHSIRTPFNMDLTKKYTGENDSPPELERWYAGMRTQFSLVRISENSIYAASIALATLDKKAHDWAIREIQRDVDLYLPSDGTDARLVASPWPLGKIRRELEARFVNPDDHIRAEADWESLRQVSDDGSLTVAELDIKLMEIAERMNEATPMQRKKRFVKALRPEIALMLHRDRQLRGWDKKDRILYRHLVKEACNIEQALNLSVRDHYGHNSYTRLVAQPQQSNVIESNKLRFSNEEDQIDAETGEKLTNLYFDDKKRPNRPNGYRTASRAPLSPEQQIEFDKRKETNACYRCGQTGHLGRDCENDRKPL